MIELSEPEIILDRPLVSSEMILAKNVRTLRNARKLTIRQVASLAGLSTKTIVAVEGGRGCSLRTLEKLSISLATSPERLRTEAELAGSSFRVVREADQPWSFVSFNEALRYQKSRILRGECKPTDELQFSPESIQNPLERFRLGTTGLASEFIQDQSGSLFRGHHVSFRVECYRPMELNKDPNGFNYVLQMSQGDVEISLHGNPHRLESGDSLFFVSSTGIQVRPIAPLRRIEDVPTFILCCLATIQ